MGKKPKYDADSRTQQYDAVEALMKNGPCMPASNATKEDVINNCLEMYQQLELVCNWCIFRAFELLDNAG